MGYTHGADSHGTNSTMDTKPMALAADLAKAITKAISETAGIPDSATTIIFQDVEKTEWAVGGVMASEDQ